MRETQAIDLTGSRFERLLVAGRAGSYRRNATWYCLCDCGAETIVMGQNLRNGSTSSCGCLAKQLTRERSLTQIKHGHARRGKKTSEYKALKNAIVNRRALVCKRWLNSFAAFLEDMGPKPLPAHKLTRLDKSKGYSPSNCTWAKASTRTSLRKPVSRTS